MPDLQPPTAEPLSIYGSPTEVSPLDWTWVDGQLEAAGIYWVVANGSGPPHPRPLWGLWIDHRLHLSIGSPSSIARSRRTAASLRTSRAGRTS